jgi:hypothetical protein
VGERLTVKIMSKKIQIGAYYFPNFHVDPRNEASRWS